MSLLSLQHLIERATQPHTRVKAIKHVRTLMKDAERDVSDEERELALHMRALRRTVLERIGTVDACQTCSARRRPANATLPNPAWAGGHCCGGECEQLFTREEVATLVTAGSKPRRMRPPERHVEHVGCAFRGHHGCVLEVEDRPNVCVRYVCRDLQKELALRGDLKEIEALCEELKEDFDAFVALQQAREERDMLNVWTRALDPGSRGQSSRSG